MYSKACAGTVSKMIQGEDATLFTYGGMDHYFYKLQIKQLTVEKHTQCMAMKRILV
jgi:hypothetical protein